MGEEKYFLPDQESLTVSGRAVEKLIRRGDGSAALLYLYILKNRGRIDRRQAAEVLGYSEQQLFDATGTLKALGLISGGNEPQTREAEPADELPDYSAEELTCEMDSGSDFRPLVTEVQTLMGKVLTQNDLKILFGIYEHLHLPAEVILLLVNCCIEEHREKYGDGKKPTMRGVEKVAYIWARNDVTTLEQALKYLKTRSAQKSAAGDIARVLHLRGELTATQRKYIYGWMDMGFGPEAVELAYDKTVTNTGELKWNYLNKILQSWHTQGLHTREEVEEKDGGSRTKNRRQSAPAQERIPDRSEVEHRNRLLERLKESPES